MTENEYGILCGPPPLWVRHEQRRAVAHKAYLWARDHSAPAGAWCFVDVSFLGGEDWQRLRVAQIVAGAGGWNRACGVQFRFGDNQCAPVRIAFERGGSWSHPGNYGVDGPYDQPTMNFGWLFEGTAEREWRRVVLHEFGHALALQHTHEQPGVPIPWDYPKVYEYFWRTNRWGREMVDGQVLTPLAREVAVTSPYGPSIMSYRIPAEILTDPAWATEQVAELTAGDVGIAQMLYGPPPVLPDTLLPIIARD